MILANHKVEVLVDDVNKQIHNWDSNMLSPDVGVTGSPCNPFSSQRAKRYQDGDVARHCSYETTMTSVVNFYQKVEPKLGVTEQVAGFDKPFVAGTTKTPLQQFP